MRLRVVLNQKSGSLFMHYLFLIMRIGFTLTRNLVAGLFAVMALVPLILIIIQLSAAGFSRLSIILGNIVFLPLGVFGLHRYDANELIFNWAAWALVLTLAAFLIKKFFRGSARWLKSPARVIHRSYLAVYSVAFCLVPFISVSADTKRSDIFAVLLFFFVTGYAAFWIARGFSRLISGLNAVMLGEIVLPVRYEKPDRPSQNVRSAGPRRLNYKRRQ